MANEYRDNSGDQWKLMESQWKVDCVETSPPIINWFEMRFISPVIPYLISFPLTNNWFSVTNQIIDKYLPHLPLSVAINSIRITKLFLLREGLPESRLEYWVEPLDCPLLAIRWLFLKNCSKRLRTWAALQWCPRKGE